MSLDHTRANRFSRVATAMLERLGPPVSPLNDVGAGRGWEGSATERRQPTDRGRDRGAKRPSDRNNAKFASIYYAASMDKWAAPACRAV